MVLWITLLLLLCNFSGYVLVLTLLSRWKALPLPEVRSNWNTSPVDPVLYVLVPTWNEQKFLRDKMVNLLGLNYERSRLKVLVCDGGSQDGSRDAIKDLLGDTIQFLDCPDRGKISQLNYGLNFVPEHALVAVSDADSFLLRPDSLLRAVDYFADIEIGVVGAWTIPAPETAMGAETAYWDKQNRMRYLETLACTSSIVTAQFYVCRKVHLASLPADCVADDVFVALAAHARNLRVIYAHEIEVVERRQPKNYQALFSHKLRKANAYSVELLRTLHRLPHLGKRRKLIYLFKIFQFFYLPWAASLFLASSALHLIRGDWQPVAAAAGILFFTTLMASLLMNPPPGKIRGGFVPSAIWQTLVVFNLVNIVLLINSLVFPFWVQDSRYARVSSK